VKRLAVLGSACDAPNDVEAMLRDWQMGNAYTVGGSGRVIARDPVSVLAGIRSHAPEGLEIVVEASDDAREALKVTRDVDAALLCGSSTSHEGDDRDSLAVDQEAFVAEVLAKIAVPSIVLVLIPGAVTIPWVVNASAAVAMFLSGQATGNAAADVLFGTTSPAGKLPVSFPKRAEDTVAPCAEADCHYNEGLFVGWRALEGKDVEFPFGHGLSYARFHYTWTGAVCDGACESLLCLSISVMNVGTVQGSEVVQLYLSLPETAEEPPKVLRGFKKLGLLPAASGTADFQLSPQDLQIFDARTMKWQTLDGEYRLLVGSSSRDIRLSQSFSVVNGVPKC